MGSKMGPSYACLNMGDIEEQILTSCTGFLPQLLKRSNDDVVGCTQYTRYNLEQYINYVSNFHPALQFTSTISELELPFLDIKLSIYGDKLQTWCTTRKLIRITISITRHSILITVRGQFHIVSFFDSAGSALMMLISQTKPQR